MTDPSERRIPRPKIWRFERLITEHAFDKLRQIDCGFAEFAATLEVAEVIEEHELATTN